MRQVCLCEWPNFRNSMRAYGKWTEPIGNGKIIQNFYGNKKELVTIPFCMVESYKISLERIKLVKILLGMAEVYRIPLGVVELVKIPLGMAEVFRISFGIA